MLQVLLWLLLGLFKIQILVYLFFLVETATPSSLVPLKGVFKKKIVIKKIKIVPRSICV